MALLQALAFMLALVFVPASAHAHTLPDSSGHAEHGTNFNQYPLDIDCDSQIAVGRHIHCHLRSTGAEAPGPVPSLDDDQPALVSRTTHLPALNTNLLSTLAVTRVPITAPPAFILFGNFRS
jgi:hypothetical protein